VLNSYKAFKRRAVMNEIAKLDCREREELFLATAHDIKLPEAMAEKDFWVCWTLGYLFHQCPWAKHIAFKGGDQFIKMFRTDRAVF